MDALCKIFKNIILNRLITWVERYNIHNEYQAGFRKNYSTIDNIFNIVNIAYLNKINGKNTYAFCVDFSYAFDLASWLSACLGLFSKIIRSLQLSYENTTSKIFYSNTFSESFNVDLGVKQGCILSPFLFAMYLNDLNDSLPGGVVVDKIHIEVLLYVDDIVILSDSSPQLHDLIMYFLITVKYGTWKIT